jgi:hypothetical protein
LSLLLHHHYHNHLLYNWRLVFSGFRMTLKEVKLRPETSLERWWFASQQ